MIIDTMALNAFLDYNYSFVYNPSKSFERSINFYNKFTKLNNNTYSVDEVNYIFDYFNFNNYSKFYDMIVDTSKKLLCYKGNKPKVDINQIINWKNFTSKNGEDLLVCAFLANTDKFDRNDFEWDYSLKTDDIKLNNILSKGVSDNHYHFKGSAPITCLNWIAMNNEIPYSCKPFSNLGKKLFCNSFPNENFKDFKLICYKSALLRIFLYKTILGYLGYPINTDSLVSIINRIGNLEDEVEYIWLLNKERINLNYGFDYAAYFTKRDGIRSGERWLLYNIFKFFKSMKTYEQDCFVMYLRLKNKFMSFFKQNNSIIGFSNFSHFDMIKDLFIENYSKFDGMLYKTSYDFALENSNLKNIEFRISPNKTKLGYKNQIDKIENSISGYPSEKYCFIYHFIKGYDTKYFSNKKYNRFYLSSRCRNYEIRMKWEKEGIALEKYLNSYFTKLKIDNKIKGIDCANNELDCRPEVASQLYRYLRQIKNNKATSFKINYFFNRFTYHVGEDFVGLVDGLRAIYEAIEYLEMGNGDRLGHCVALGININNYYNFKKFSLIKRKQNALDDYAWLLKLSKKIPCDPLLISHIRDEAQVLFDYIYDSNSNLFNLDDYIYSLELRGDNPYAYVNKILYKSPYGYNSFSYRHNIDTLPESDSYSIARRNKKSKELYIMYHFNYNVKEKGEEKIQIQVGKEIFKFISDVQVYIKKMIIKKGICIETNPTSNYLIAPISEFKDLPLLNFNLYHLVDNYLNVPICVNTDDQGIFCTCLDNEFALLFNILSSSDSPLDFITDYSKEKVYEYIDYLRELGNSYSFNN